MAKKESKKKESIDIKELFESKFAKTVKDNIKDFVVELIHKAQEAVYTTLKQVAKGFAAVIVLLIGLTLILVGLSFVIEEYFRFPKGTGFLIIGLIIILISSVYLKVIKKNKFLKKQ